MDGIGIDKSALRTKSELLIVLFIYLSIFINSYVFFTEPFEFQFGYLIYLILLPVFIVRYGVGSDLVKIFAVLLITGVFNVLLGNNTFGLFFKVFSGLLLSYFFYYYVILEFNYDIEQLFKWYLEGAFYASVLGIFQFVAFQINFLPGYTFFNIFNKWSLAPGGIFGIRVNSIFSEPTHLSAVLAGAFFISVYSMLKGKIYISRFKSAVIIAAYILSFSGLGQMGMFLTLLLLALNFGFLRYVIVAVPALIILFNVLYNNVDDFKDRYDGLISLFKGEEFQLGKTHGSSFILYNNFQVTVENFKSNFLFGSGIGSHPVAFEKYSIAKHIKQYGFNLNSADANSMFLRLVSETGLFGIGLFLVIVFKCYVRRNSAHLSFHWLISNAILIMILLNLFRQGHYFLNGFPFFVLLYYYNYLSYRNEITENSDSSTNNLS